MAGRKTLQKSCSIEGYGIHSGTFCKLIFSPCDAGSGIRFHHDSFSSPICVHPSSIGSINRATSLSLEGDTVYTPEHLLGACCGTGIWDLDIFLEGGLEIPILDGSALDFVDLFLPY